MKTWFKCVRSLINSYILPPHFPELKWGPDGKYPLLLFLISICTRFSHGSLNVWGLCFPSVCVCRNNSTFREYDKPKEVYIYLWFYFSGAYSSVALWYESLQLAKRLLGHYFPLVPHRKVCEATVGWKAKTHSGTILQHKLTTWAEPQQSQKISGQTLYPWCLWHVVFSEGGGRGDEC